MEFVQLRQDGIRRGIPPGERNLRSICHTLLLRNLFSALREFELNLIGLLVALLVLEFVVFVFSDPWKTCSSQLSVNMRFFVPSVPSVGPSPALHEEYATPKRITNTKTVTNSIFSPIEKHDGF